jgi:hypothetical protein
VGNILTKRGEEMEEIDLGASWAVGMFCLVLLELQ